MPFIIALLLLVIAIHQIGFGNFLGIVISLLCFGFFCLLGLVMLVDPKEFKEKDRG